MTIPTTALINPVVTNQKNLERSVGDKSPIHCTKKKLQDILVGNVIRIQDLVMATSVIWYSPTKSRTETSTEYLWWHFIVIQYYETACLWG